MQKITVQLFILLACVAFSACSNFHFPRVYKIELAQGNKIDEAQLKKLQPGMTQKQVIYLLGSPLLEGPLQSDRWHYYYSLKPSGHSKQEVKHLVVYFNNELFSRYEIIKTP